uniref:Ribosomal protein S4 n=1 Tax=Mallomonas splendens TaxID=52552 RepID=A0A3G2QZF7_9STRA|nr:ribosomal protein S4 [Mallomonas splendens]AYO28497.1 ribosomal protein S4 [Mallomonas splendens]
MARYTGPKIRIIRRLGLLPGLTRKNIKNRNTTPGQHGKPLFTKKNRSSLSDDYRERLYEKQKLRFNYGITEKQLYSYYQQAKREPGSTGNLLLQLLESRLDCVIHRLGFAPTIPSARQIVNHGHIFVNGKLVNIPSFLCQKEDIITVRDRKQSKNLIKVNFEYQQQKRTLIQRRMKRVNLSAAKSRFHSLLPTHLKVVDNENLIGQFICPVKRKDVLVRVNELKVVEYYSR